MDSKNHIKPNMAANLTPKVEGGSLGNRVKSFETESNNVQGDKSGSPLHDRAQMYLNKSHTGISPSGPRKAPGTAIRSMAVHQTGAVQGYLDKAMPGHTPNALGAKGIDAAPLDCADCNPHVESANRSLGDSEDAPGFDNVSDSYSPDGNSGDNGAGSDGDAY